MAEHNRQLRLPRHPRAHVLLAFLDGELDGGSHAEIAVHLERCWRCRSRQRRLERAVESFVTARKDWSPPPDDDLARNRLRHRLADVRQRGASEQSPTGGLLLHKHPHWWTGARWLAASIAIVSGIAITLAAAGVLPFSRPRSLDGDSERLVERSPDVKRSSRETAGAPPAPIADVVSPPVPLSWAEMAATDEEVAVAVALHDAGACLGEEVRVFPLSNGTLLVHGLVESVARRAELRTRLQRERARVRVELYTEAEKLSGVTWYPAPEGDLGAALLGSADVVRGSESAPARRISDGRIPLSASLRATLLERGERDPDASIARLADEMMAVSRLVVLHAWAVARHDAEFSPGRTHALSSSAAAAARHVIDSHEHAFEIQQRAIREQLAAVNLLIAPSVLSTADAPMSPQQRLRVSVEQYRLMGDLFTATSTMQSIELALARLGELLVSASR